MNSLQNDQLSVQAPTFVRDSECSMRSSGFNGPMSSRNSLAAHRHTILPVRSLSTSSGLLSRKNSIVVSSDSMQSFRFARASNVAERGSLKHLSKMQGLSRFASPTTSSRPSLSSVDGDADFTGLLLLPNSLSNSKRSAKAVHGSALMTPDGRISNVLNTRPSQVIPAVALRISALKKTNDDGARNSKTARFAINVVSPVSRIGQRGSHVAEAGSCSGANLGLDALKSPECSPVSQQDVRSRKTKTRGNSTYRSLSSPVVSPQEKLSHIATRGTLVNGLRSPSATSRFSPNLQSPVSSQSRWNSATASSSPSRFNMGKQDIRESKIAFRGTEKSTSSDVLSPLASATSPSMMSRIYGERESNIAFCGSEASYQGRQAQLASLLSPTSRAGHVAREIASLMAQMGTCSPMSMSSRVGVPECSLSSRVLLPEIPVQRQRSFITHGSHLSYHSSNTAQTAGGSHY